MKQQGVLAEGTISDEILEAWEDRIGINLRIGNIFNQTVSVESIRNYLNGIGDNNLLYREPEYAAKSKYRGLIAPPNWLYSVFPTWVLQGLAGIHAFHSGNDWVFYKPLFPGDFVSAKCKFMGYDVKPSKFAGKTVFEYQRSSFFNQKEELVAETDLWLVRAERQVARKTGKYNTVQLPHPYTDRELKMIDEQVLNEEIRGDQPRYWEDVRVGEELPKIVKGPFGLTDMIAYCVGAAPVQIAAHGTQLALYKKHPAWGFRDPFTRAWEPVYGVHYNMAAAKSAGLPFPYDVGAQRQGWLISFLCNWMGDEGWLKRNYAEYRKFVYHSDTVWFSGKIVKKYKDLDGEFCVDVETSAVNQRGEDTMPGYSTIVLPSRESISSPIERRLKSA